jgi:hypothetical protein
MSPRECGPKTDHSYVLNALMNDHRNAPDFLNYMTIVTKSKLGETETLLLG